MVNHRKLTFERIIENLKKGKYRGKIISADYSNAGIQPFEEKKFSEQLGVPLYWLREIGLIQIKMNCGWNLPTEPTVEELLSFKKQIEEKLSIGEEKSGTNKRKS